MTSRNHRPRTSGFISSPSPEKDVGFGILGLLSAILGFCSDSSLDSEELEESLGSGSGSSSDFSGSDVGESGLGSGSGVLGLSVPLPFGDFGKLPGNSVSGLSVASRWVSPRSWALTASLLSNSETISCWTSFAKARSSGFSSSSSSSAPSCC